MSELMGILCMIMSMFGYDKLEDQIRAEEKSNWEGKTKKDYLIRGENNQMVRWSITLIIATAHTIRILYFDHGYYLLTAAMLMAFAEKLYSYLFDDPLNILEASDWASADPRRHPELKHSEPLIAFYFRRQLSPPLFNSLVLRILEFKFWYFSTKLVLYGFLLTWYTLIKFPFFGLEVILSLIFYQGCRFVYALTQKSAGVTFVDG